MSNAPAEKQPEEPQLDWTTAKWTMLGAWLPIILASGIAVVPSGMEGVRVSQTSGTRPGTLYPGGHLIETAEAGAKNAEPEVMSLNP